MYHVRGPQYHQNSRFFFGAPFLGGLLGGVAGGLLGGALLAPRPGFYGGFPPYAYGGFPGYGYGYGAPYI